MSEFKIGQQIVHNGVNGYVVYPFAMPSADGPGITVKLMNSRHTVVVPEHELWHRNDYYIAAYRAELAERIDSVS